VSWTSSNPAVATINTMGLAVAISVGASNVQAALNGINVSTTLAINSAVTVAVSPVSVKLTVSTGTQQFVATVGNDPQNGGVNWNLSGAGCSGAACGTLSATSSASGASITYNAPPAVPSPATLTLTATSVSDSTISNSALITITNGSTPVGSTFTESFSSSNPCWANGPSSCDQGWVAQGSAQAIVATPGAPPPNTAGSNALQMTEPSGSAAYIYTAGSFPRIPSGTQFDLYFMIDVASQAMNASDATRLLTLSAYADGSAYPAQVSLLYDGVNLQLQAGGATFTAKTNISLNSWHSVQLHVASGSNSSFLSIDRGPASPFTENPQDFADLLIGSVAGNFDALTYYIGNVYVNSPLGGGPPPSAYIDFENSTNGTNVTPAILAASTHCGNGVWSLSMTPMTGMAISTGGQETLPSPITTCGTQYTDTGTQGLQYDMSQAARTARYTWSTVSSSASVGFFFQITVSDSNYYSAFNIDGGGGSDYATLNVHGGSMYLETKQGITNPVAISPNVWYWVTIQYNAGGTHYMQVYDGTSFALLGSVSNTATGNFPPTDIEIGRTGSENGFPSAFWYYDNIVIDYLTAKFPILPGSY
jgi:hypothetical protein